MTPHPAGSAAARLWARPFDYEFFQAVRLLERVAGAAPPVGGDGPPAAEAVRFRVLNSVSFPPSVVADLRDKPGGPPELTVAFFGLTGPVGVLPRHYTELVARLSADTKAAERDALRDWLDLFHHRLLSLFYRAWEKYRLWAARERDSSADAGDAFTSALRAFVGLGTGGLRGRGRLLAADPLRTLAAVADETVLYYAGHFAHRPRNAAGLEALLSDFVGAAVKVVPFRGQWLTVDDGRAGVGAEASMPLGDGPILGGRVWDLQSKFRLRIGPVNAEGFAGLLPDPSAVPAGKRFYLIEHLARLYAGAEFDIEVQVIVEAAAVPRCRLPVGTAPGPRLGRDAWLSTMTPGRDAADAVFAAHAPAEARA